jgi:hypothetical protein
VIDFEQAKKRLRPERLRPFRIIALLDQAERFRALIEAGSVNQSDLARLYGMTRARVTQILNLLRLHPAVVDYLRGRHFVGHGRAPTERSLRPLVAKPAEAQLEAAQEGLPGFAANWRGQLGRDEPRAVSGSG